MLKKNLLYIACIAYAVHAHANVQVSQETQIPEKIKQLYRLQEITENLNRLQSTNYILAVPPFIELTPQDIHQFLSAIPSGIMDNRTKKPLSMLQFIQNLWSKIVEHARLHKKITPLIREHLIEIRAALEAAFHHHILAGPVRPTIRSFLKTQQELHNSLIIRATSESPFFGAKTCYPIAPEKITAGIARMIQSYFSEKNISEQINQGSISPSLNIHAVIQSIITEDPEAQEVLVSGVSCSYDAHSHIKEITTITSVFGNPKALCDPNMVYDTYFIHDTSVYPIIRKKLNRFVPDMDRQRSRLVPNDPQMQITPTLDIQSAQEIARFTKILEEHFQQPVCVTFIKRDNTIYFIKIQVSDISFSNAPNFFDPLYVEHLSAKNKIRITPIKPYHSLVVTKKREQIILAPNIRTFVKILNKRKKSKNVLIGIIKDKPSTQSKDFKLIEDISVPIVWTPDFEKIRSKIQENKYPLVFDMQQKTAFPFKRRQGFCTLFQAVQSGIYTHPTTQHISILPDFMRPLTAIERTHLKPNELFSGVTLDRLFDLLRTGSMITAEAALNTILFRLQKQIQGEYITKKECTMALAPFDFSRCERMEQMYMYVERIAYELFKQLERLYHPKATSRAALEKNFLVNVLQAVITQQPNEDIIGSESFMHEASKP
jgi:hypothetical protein